MNIQLTVDKEFESLIQPLTDQELVLLTEQILRDGCREPLSVWKTEDDQRILLDGHNRYKICSENRRDFQTVNIKLASREQAKLWILEHQVGRRNLTDDQRAIIWNEIREQRSKVASIEAAAKARAAKASPVQTDSAKTTETANAPAILKVDTRKAVATESKIPESKLRKVQQLKKTNPQLYEAVRTGAVTLRQAPKPKPAKKDLRTRYSEKDYFARIGRMLAGTLVKHPRLDELLTISKSDWTPEAEYGFKCLLKNLDEVSERAHAYASGLNKILRSYGKAIVETPEPPVVPVIHKTRSIQFDKKTTFCGLREGLVKKHPNLICRARRHVNCAACLAAIAEYNKFGVSDEEVA